MEPICLNCLPPVLFPSKAFEGIMNDQKLRKLHQQSKDKEMGAWELSQLYSLTKSRR